MTEEKRLSLSSYFVTLTYDDKSLPNTDFGSSVCQVDHVKFIKDLKFYETGKQLKKRDYISEEEMSRMRDRIGEFRPGYRKGDHKIKYYGVAEYGDKFGRVHLHYILFNVRDTNNINLSWNYGRVQIDECNVNTIDYVLKYMIKHHLEETYENKAKEKCWMSKGIGKEAVNAEFIKYIKSEVGNVVINERGGKVPLPRYYRKKYVTEDEAKIKNAYVNEVLLQKEIKEDRDYLSLGKNPDQMRKQAKDIRQHMLKTREKRNKV